MMSATTREKEQLSNRAVTTRLSFFQQSSYRQYLAAIIFGSIYGLSAPGHDKWYLAWCALIPLLYLIFGQESRFKAAWQATVFGFAYNFVYLYWLYDIHSSENCPVYLRILLVLCVCLHQSLLFGAFALLARSKAVKAMPLLLPLLWVLVFNKLGNSQVFFGVPWSMIEYSQYQNSAVLSLCPLIGGIGIGALLLQSNFALFLLSGGTRYFTRAASTGTLIFSLAVSALAAAIIIVQISGSAGRVEKQLIEPHANLTLLQGNTSFKRHKASVSGLVDRYMALADSAPSSTASIPSICLWPEWSMPLHFRTRHLGARSMAGLAAMHQQDWIVGALDSDSLGRRYNAVYAFSSQGKMLEATYRKRMLVLFGEYMPWLLATPQGETYASGTKAVCLDFAGASIGPLICLEVVSPEFSAESTRMGAQLLVDASNTTWFDTGMVGRQMLAFSVFRAAECGRYLAFCTTTGPSFVIDRKGKIATCTEANKTAAPTTRVTLYEDLTPFVRWFR